MRFACEQHLVTALAAGISAVFPGYDRVETEVPSRLGIADLVIARTNRDRLGRRTCSNLEPVLMVSAAQILSQLCSDGLVSESGIFGSACVDPQHGRRVLKGLALSGHAVGGVDGWSLAPGILDPYDEIVAIEAKLDDWRRADAQAERYRMYADRAYVALPNERVTPAAVEFFARGSVGLLSVGDEIAVVVEARVATPREPWRRLLVSEVLTARLAGSRTHLATLGMPASRFPREVRDPFAATTLAL